MYKHKSNGFIYPAVLFVSAVVLLVISYTSSDFITHKTFEKETAEFCTVENLLQNGALLSIRHVLQGQKGLSGKKRFSYGVVSYEIRASIHQDELDMFIKGETRSGTKREAHISFDQKKKKLIQWTEV
ncbi:competence type IV pilus minor pilin ComGG [Bacillus nakamurai]|uniref:competence type IV pilus minor pilin ComGG n=1 Tax=Bacillus nakamurai TaxID=1793963 RepID=UPI001E3C9719|nr:competence type IV pilus minor pilin ComGG [Bacillus nakamurai]MCC9023125.1 competence protein ComG [Bacillus nakamurai]